MKTHSISIDIPDGAIVTGHALIIQYVDSELVEANQAAIAIDYEGGHYLALGLATGLQNILANGHWPD